MFIISGKIAHNFLQKVHNYVNFLFERQIQCQNEKRNLIGSIISVKSKREGLEYSKTSPN